MALGNVALFRRAQAVASAETRQAIARDLHDSVSQTLFSVTLQVRAAQAELRKAGIGEDHPAARALAEVSELNQGALAEMRALIFELRPGALAEEGLVAAVSKHAAAVAAREGIDVDVTGPADRLPLSPEAEEQLYRLTQEALNNVVKHARTTLASVAVTSGPADVSVVVRDDGIGFDPSLGRPGIWGLASMRDRAARLVGRLDIASAPRRRHDHHGHRPRRRATRAGEAPHEPAARRRPRPRARCRRPPGRPSGPAGIPRHHQRHLCGRRGQRW